MIVQFIEVKKHSQYFNSRPLVCTNFVVDIQFTWPHGQVEIVDNLLLLK